MPLQEPQGPAGGHSGSPSLGPGGAARAVAASEGPGRASSQDRPFLNVQGAPPSPGGATTRWQPSDGSGGRVEGDCSGWDCEEKGTGAGSGSVSPKVRNARAGGPIMV